MRLALQSFCKHLEQRPKTFSFIVDATDEDELETESGKVSRQLFAIIRTCCISFSFSFSSLPPFILMFMLWPSLLPVEKLFVMSKQSSISQYSCPEFCPSRCHFSSSTNLFTFSLHAFGSDCISVPALLLRWLCVSSYIWASIAASFC